MTQPHVIFCGDIALPFGAKADFSNVTELFAGCSAVANLEGAILEDDTLTDGFRHSDKFSLYSSPQALDLLQAINVKAVSLCNNHILDYRHPIEHTTRLLSQHGIGSFGLNNHDVIEIPFGARKLLVITFATYASEHSLPLFSPEKVIREVERLRADNLDASIVIYPHWGRERFHYPDPADRELARRLIDSGADLIVGHHPHVVQPMEIYNGKHIIYSVGNFLLSQGKYGKRNLTYRTSAPVPEIIVKWDGKTPTIIPLQFDPTTNTLVSGSQSNVQMDFISSDLSARDYRKLVMSKSGMLDRLMRTRIFQGTFGERICYMQRRSLRLFRHLLMTLHLHTPR